MKSKKQHYGFWRWLILTIIRFPKLYALAWGIIILATVIFLQGDVLNLLKGWGQ